VQKDIQNLDETARTAEATANILGMASASPFKFSLLYEPKINGTISFANSTFNMTLKNKTVTHPLYFPIKTNSTVEINNCLNITRTNVTEVFKCQ
jgi:hypothetical protein